jgi:hypothetical protein
MTYSSQFSSSAVTVSHCKQVGALSTTRLARSVVRLLSFVSLLSMSVMLQAQVQLGSNIDGAAVPDNFGWSVALSSDGQRLVVGARVNDGGGFDSGQVRVYQWSGTDWLQYGADINGEAAYDESGYSVALSEDGDRLAIGAPGNDGNGFDAGHVRVYQYSNSAWQQLGDDIDGEAAYDGSGISVSLSANGSRLAIGAIGNDGNGFDAGHVRVYQLSGDDWVQLGDDMDGEAAYDGSGVSVSLSSDGSQLSVGADQNDGNGINAGHVRIYEYSDADWSQLGDDIDGESFGDYSGHSASLSAAGDRVAIGAPYNIDDSGAITGHVRVYQYSDAEWVQLGDDLDGEAASDQSGGSVSLSSDGNRLLVGALGNDGGGLNSGHARVHQWVDGSWNQLGDDIDGEAPENAFGRSVALSSNGNSAGIGATLYNENVPSAGHVRVFDLSMFNTFELNAGLNDAWYNPATDGQGFFISVFPETGIVSLAWFTYDTELPPDDAQAKLGDPGHRWMTAVGPINGNQVLMNIEMTSGGLFDTATEIERTDPTGSDGTILLTFEHCESGTVKYDITSINQTGTVPIQRVANDNVALCEALESY